MASDVEICSQAFHLIGNDAIADFDDNNDRAKLAKAIYEDTRDEVLRMHPWNFAMVRAELAQEDEGPEFGYTYQYALPSDPKCLRVLSMEDEDAEFVIEGGKLLTDEGTAKIKYISQITDPGMFDALFTSALILLLASKFAGTFKKDLVEIFYKLYLNKLEEARSVNAMEGTPPILECETLINVRY